MAQTNDSTRTIKGSTQGYIMPCALFVRFLPIADAIYISSTDTLLLTPSTHDHVMAEFRLDCFMSDNTPTSFLIHLETSEEDVIRRAKERMMRELLAFDSA